MTGLDEYLIQSVRLAFVLPGISSCATFLVHAMMLGVVVMNLTCNILIIVAFYRRLFNR